jgi:cytochrome c oxidase subunit 2
MNNRVENHHQWRGGQFMTTLGLGFLIVLLASCSPNTPSIFDPHSLEAGRIANLSWLMFGIAALVFVVITVLLLLVVIRARRSELAADISSKTDRRTIIWILIGGAVIPVAVLFIVMVLSVVTDKANAASDNGTLTIEVVGHRWWWEIHYPDRNITTANEIHIPVNQPVVLRVTSADVIHSLWIPQLNGKFDMIPGQTNSIAIQATTVGSYRGECAEFCGLQHAHMAFIVVAEEPDQFDKWATKQAQPAANLDPHSDAMVFEGQQTFLGSSCVYCHTIKGTNASGTLGPDLTHIASRATIGAGILPNTPGNLAGWIINSQAIKPGNFMPPMALDPDQLQAILAYFQTLQ